VPVSEAEQVTLKETEIGPVPEHWEVAELGRAVDIVYGIQAPVAHLLDPSIGVPILTNVNVTNDGILDVSTLRYYKIPENKRDRFLLKKGDLLFNWRSGSASHVGKTALFNLDGEYTFSSFILRFRVVADSINSNFLFRYLNHLKGLGFFATNRMQSSVNSVFNASLAARIPVLIPHSPEQQRISQMLTAVDRKIGIEQNRKAAVQALFKTMLHLLMTGKVRIKELEALVV
jgi:type I restriction enzyme S subunit